MNLVHKIFYKIKKRNTNYNDFFLIKLCCKIYQKIILNMTYVIQNFFEIYSTKILKAITERR